MAWRVSNRMAAQRKILLFILLILSASCSSIYQRSTDYDAARPYYQGARTAAGLSAVCVYGGVNGHPGYLLLCPLMLPELVLSTAADTLLLPADYLYSNYKGSHIRSTRANVKGDFSLIETATYNGKTFAEVKFKNNSIIKPDIFKDCFVEENKYLVSNSMSFVGHNTGQSKWLISSKNTVNDKQCFLFGQEKNNQPVITLLSETYVGSNGLLLLYSTMSKADEILLTRGVVSSTNDIKFYNWDPSIKRREPPEFDTRKQPFKLYWTMVVSVSPDYKQAVYIANDRQELWIYNTETKQRVFIPLSKKHQAYLTIKLRDVNGSATQQIDNLYDSYYNIINKLYKWGKIDEDWQWIKRPDAEPLEHNSDK